MKKLLGSRKYLSAISAFIALNITYLITEDVILSSVAASGFVANTVAVGAQNMMQIKKAPTGQLEGEG